MEKPYGTAGTYHIVYRLVVQGQSVNIDGFFYILPVDKLHGLAQRGKHSKSEHVQFNQSKCFHIVLIELHHFYAVRGNLNRRKESERFTAKDHAPHVKAEMAGAVGQAFYECQ